MPPRDTTTPRTVITGEGFWDQVSKDNAFIKDVYIWREEQRTTPLQRAEYERLLGRVLLL